MYVCMFFVCMYVWAKIKANDPCLLHVYETWLTY